MQICILSDTHGHIHPNINALANVSDYVIHAGDIGNGAVLHALTPKQATIAVLGNNDHSINWPREDKAQLATLTEQNALALPSGTIAVEHGHRVNPIKIRHDKLRDRHPEARLIVYGHSHLLMIDDTESPWVVNPGAAGRARTHGGPSCLLLTITDNDWQIQEQRFQW